MGIDLCSALFCLEYFFLILNYIYYSEFSDNLKNITCRLKLNWYIVERNCLILFMDPKWKLA